MQKNHVQVGGASWLQAPIEATLLCAVQTIFYSRLVGGCGWEREKEKEKSKKALWDIIT